ncbi:zinc finger BED domain-containing protein 5-like [Diabrotica undecimpunctata]|uniref:zinc finger BED domain-containing protein 5-like n=1 Tax=Diabrotica undecimpunctata TaxID=50387 RepID=UPI003B63906E
MDKSAFVRRRVGEKYHKDCIVERVKHPLKIMVWCVISSKGTGRLYIVNGMMNQHQYIKVLERKLMPQIKDWFETTAITDQDDYTTTSSSTISKAKKRKYDESYNSFGSFDSNGSPLCILCSKLIPNSSMAPAKLRRHLETVHPESKGKNKEFFLRKKEQSEESQKTMMHVTQTINEKATVASYLVSYHIAQEGEAHTIAENLIKPCVLDITKYMLNKKSAKHLSTVPLSNDTVSRRIHDLTSYTKQELVTRLQKTRFALQIDESTDVAGLAILLVIVRYPYESSFEEDMLMCSPLATNTTEKEIFNKINTFFEENNLSWNDCIDICTDVAKAMTGNIAGLVSRIKNKAPNCSSSHCILHRQALAMTSTCDDKR